MLKTDKTLQIIDKEKNHRIRDMYKSCEVLNELAEENEQLRKELDSFNPVIFQDMRKGTVILYSKGDIDEWGK